jgi:hypothetical protein
MSLDPFKALPERELLDDPNVRVREVGWLFKQIMPYTIVGHAVSIGDSNSIREMITDSNFVFELNNSETVRGAFALNKPSFKVWLGFLIGLMLGTMFLGKIFYAIFRF